MFYTEVKNFAFIIILLLQYLALKRLLTESDGWSKTLKTKIGLTVSLGSKRVYITHFICVSYHLVVLVQNV